MKINIIPRTMDIRTLSEMVSAGSSLFFIAHNKSVRLLNVTSLESDTDIKYFFNWINGESVLIEVIHEEKENE